MGKHNFWKAFWGWLWYFDQGLELKKRLLIFFNHPFPRGSLRENPLLVPKAPKECPWQIPLGKKEGTMNALW